MRVAVCGGTATDDRQRVFQSLDSVHEAAPITDVIHMDCAHAAEWAWWRGALVSTFTDWNVALTEFRPDLVIAFEDTDIHIEVIPRLVLQALEKEFSVLSVDP